MGEKDAQLLRTYWSALFTAILLIGGGYFGYQFITQEEKTLANDLTPLGYLGERIEHDLNSEPLLEISEELSIADTLKDGIDITFKNETTLISEDETEELFLNFPKNLDEPMEITLPGGSFTVTHDSNQDYKAELLTSKETPELIQDESLGGPTAKSEEIAKYVRYTSADERKQIYYAYQKDQAEGYRNLKHWTLYNHGIGIESESYTFTNVTLKINDRGEVEGRFLTPFGNEQDSINNTQDVDEDLWARAQRVMALDLEQSTPPDFIIPPPYYLDQYGRQATLEWALNNDADTISVAFNPLPGEYPVALDPTLQFTAPGVSNSGDVIDGDGGSYGYVLTVGDLNSDGKNDLVVSATGYGANGRVYIFGADNTIPENASDAYITIDGENSGDGFGNAVNVADFNGDGKDDLAVGASKHTSDTGRVYIFYNDGAYPALAANADEKIDGEGSNGTFGGTLGSGDLDADGDTDLVVGATEWPSNSGSVYVFYNDGAYPSLATGADVEITGAGGWQFFSSALAVADMDNDGDDDLLASAGFQTGQKGRIFIFYNDGAYPALAGDADHQIIGENNYDLFGETLVVGDLNDDGRTDLAAGVRYDTSNTGKVHIFYNDGAYPINATGSDAVIAGENTNNEFGVGLAAGDLNGDGKGDLVVAANAYDTISNEGRVYIFYGGSLASSTATSADVMATGEGTTNYFGSSIAVGDMNGDGQDDLVTSAIGYSSFQGRVYIFYSQSGQVNLNDHITGEGTNDLFGSAFAVGDFNNDGRDDLVVGAYKDNSDTGKVYLFYNDGDYGNLASTSDWAITGSTTSHQFGRAMHTGDFNNDGVDDLVVGSIGDDEQANIFYGGNITANTASEADVIFTGENGNDSFGWYFATGDMNSDGKDDLIVSALAYPSGAAQGRVYIFYGGSMISDNATNADVILTGEAGGDGHGYALTVGDFNGDGIDDLASDSYYYGANEGRVHVYYGGNIVTKNATSSDVIYTGEGGSNYLGNSLASGDLNSDGIDDLLVGAKGYTSAQGRVYVFHGGAMSSSSASLANTIITGEKTLSSFGSSVSTGDMNNDGKTDIIVGSGYDVGSNTNEGRVYVFYNDGSYSEYASTSDLIITGSNSNDDLGYAIITGDFNNDGKDDLVVGAPGYDNGGDTGRVYFYETREDYAWDIQRQSLSDGVRVDPIMGYEMKITGEYLVDAGGLSLWGYSQAHGDLNADGRPDLIVSGLYSERVYIFFNDGDYPSAAGRADVIIQGETGGGSDNFGKALAVGDLNHDGVDDLAIGAPGYGSFEGRVYLFYGGTSFYAYNATDADEIITGDIVHETLGNDIAIGDMDNDGDDDLVVAGEDISTGFSYDGRVTIYYNDGAYPTDADDADVIIAGEGTNTHFGEQIAIGDLDGDGDDDLIVYDDVNQISVIYNDGSYPSNKAGADATISTFFGSSIFLLDLDRDGVKDIVSNGGDDFYGFLSDGSYPATYATADVQITGEQFSGFPYVGVEGDFNHDGKNDFAFSFSGYDVGSNTNEGQVIIFTDAISSGTTTASSADMVLYGEVGSYYGYSLGAYDMNNDGGVDLAIGGAAYNSNQGRLYFYTTNDRHITGEGADSFFGYSLTAGDYNDDGKKDLAVGAYGHTGGTTYVFFGGAKATTSATGADVMIDGSASFGYALATGDFNSDGKDDLSVGDHLIAGSRGDVYLFYGGSSFSPSVHTDADVTITGELSSEFGSALTVGDINNDGKDDLLAAGTRWDNNTTGRVYIFYGDGSIPTTAATADVIYTGEDINNYFGYSLAVGDLNSDGVDDVLVGAIGYSSRGRIYVFHSTSTPASRSGSAADVIITADNIFYNLGGSVTIGDYNGDGQEDLAAGAYRWPSDFTGQAYVFYGDSIATGLVSSADVVISGEVAGDWFARSMTTGDMNTDGRDDLIISGHQSETETGRAYVFYGDSLRSTGAENANVVISGETTDTYFGASVLAADMSDNGVDDLVIGAMGFDDPNITNNDEGRVYIIMSEAAAEHRSSYKIRGDVKIRGTVKFH